MSPHFKVTIGMCIKNAEATIKESLESVVNQDFPHTLMEIIVVDGCSIDKTLEIIRTCLENIDIESRIFRENQGLGQARQIVVDNAADSYIVWVDGDMILSHDFVRKQVEFMEQNSDVGIAKGKYDLVHGANLLGTLEIYSRAAAKLAYRGQENNPVKSLGTSGCIYRVKAIREAGGFDTNIKGYGEDWDAEFRVKAAGWLLCTTIPWYRDYERLGLTWKNLWKRYWRRGYDLHDVFKKHKGILRLYKMLPPAAFLLGLFNSLTLYRMIREKIVFFMPVQYTFKMTAWCLGYAGRKLETSGALFVRDGDPATELACG